MSIYLAISVYKLIGILLVWAILCGLLVWSSYKQGAVVKPKAAYIMAAVYFVFVLFSAFNVGQRQSELQRQSFDATMPPAQQEQAIKQQKHDIDSVKATFEQAVKQTKE